MLKNKNGATIKKGKVSSTKPGGERRVGTGTKRAGLQRSHRHARKEFLTVCNARCSHNRRGTRVQDKTPKPGGSTRVSVRKNTNDSWSAETQTIGHNSGDSIKHIMEVAGKQADGTG